MELHLPLVLATPTLLGLAAAFAAVLWPRRAVLWPFLLPMWAIGASFHGLLACRDEIRGPALAWFRLDAPGIWLAMVLGPTAALVLRWFRHTPAVGALRAAPWRLALTHAAVATLGMLPLPGVPALAVASGAATCRSRAAGWGAAVTALGAVACWPWPAAADGAVVIANLAFAAALGRTTAGWHAWFTLALLQALLAMARASGLT